MNDVRGADALQSTRITDRCLEGDDRVKLRLNRPGRPRSSAIAWVAPRSAGGAIVDVYVDGRLLRHVNLDLPSGTYPSRVVASIAWETKGTHTIKLVKPEGAYDLPLDAFLVLE